MKTNKEVKQRIKDLHREYAETEKQVKRYGDQVYLDHLYILERAILELEWVVTNPKVVEE